MRDETINGFITCISVITSSGIAYSSSGLSIPAKAAITIAFGMVGGCVSYLTNRCREEERILRQLEEMQEEERLSPSPPTKYNTESMRR